MKLYNLDVIISLGYRVNSKQAAKISQWASRRLKEYLIEGYLINHKRVEENSLLFLQTLEYLNIISHNNPALETKDLLSIVSA